MGEEVRRVGEGVRREHIIFVENLPPKLDVHGLKGIFKRAGKVNDAYIPMKKGRRNNTRYGFVRLWRPEEAVKSLMLFNNYIIRGCCIKVCMARYHKGRSKSVRPKQQYRLGSQKVRKEWRRKDSFE